MRPEEVNAIDDDQVVEIVDTQGRIIYTMTGRAFKDEWIDVQPLKEHIDRMINEELNKIGEEL